MCRVIVLQLSRYNIVQLFIMRHGEAEPRAESDSQRELTDQGRQDIAQMVQRYSSDLAAVDVIWVSPYVRAQQTAEIVSGVLEVPIITQSCLPPNGNPADVLDMLQNIDEQTVLMVSHQPLVGVLVDDLAGLESGRYRMGTGSLANIQTDVYAKGCCELLWLHQPNSFCLGAHSKRGDLYHVPRPQI